MNEVQVYFSDFFNVDKEIIESYGAVNISLINDLPLFIDPFLLFNSKDPDYQKIHHEMIDYLLFLKEQAKCVKELTPGMEKAWYTFSEVKQTWLGFSLHGNSGRGMGSDFAKGLYDGLNSIFHDFGTETITQGRHMEKLCLISPRVGRDKISDFTTNFAKQYLLEYTERFAREYLRPEQCLEVCVPRVHFEKETLSWSSEYYYLPWHEEDYVLLTPKRMLTRDDTFINRTDMLSNLKQIAPSIPNEALRFELEEYFINVLSKKDKEISHAEKVQAAESLIARHPVLIDYYMRYKEEREEQATSISKEKVREVQTLYIEQISKFIQLLDNLTDFYQVIPNAYEAAMQRVLFLKHVIEDQDGYRLFYSNGSPIKRESDLQVIYRLVWYGTPLSVDREVNNGRGPVDYKVSFGKNNAVLVEFKLASNTKLKQNLAKQVEVYKKASDTKKSIKVIMFFSDEEEQKIFTILNELRLADDKSIVLIDARDNKISASNVKL